MQKKLVVPLCLFLIFLMQSVCVVFSSNQVPHVLILRQRKRGTTDWGGIATHTLTLYKKLLENGIDVHMLVPANSPPEKHLLEQNLPFFTFKDDKSFIDESGDCFGDPESMYRTALDICKNYQINIIHVNLAKEIKIAKKLSSAFKKKQKIEIVYQHHGFASSNTTSKLGAFTGISAFISVNKDFIEYLKQNNPGIKEIKYLPPITQLYQNKKMEEGLAKDEFFKKRFNIKINPVDPVLCCVAHFFPCKNHEILFKAIHKLIHDYQLPVQLVLAGDGTAERSTFLRKKVEQLQLQNNVHFLGFVTNIPELLLYSDIKVLVSKQDPFALAVIEASLMKKPVVISKEIGVANTFIFHEKTGLLCDPNSIDDIALQIQRLIQAPSLAKELGGAAYDMASAYYLLNGLALEYINIYKRVLKNSTKPLKEEI